ncbi:MAG: hypothetical protein Q7S86_05790 [bacterium]|nr:hypothetical protein [bacterium]
MNLGKLNADMSERLRSVRYTEPEVFEIIKFLNKFCCTAKICLTELFVRSRIYKHPRNLETVLLICNFYDDVVWKYSSPDRYGDPDDISIDANGVCRGARNTGAIVKAYGAVGLPMPKGIH